MPEVRGVVERKHPNPDEFDARVSFVDPAWSLEKIIGSLAGFGDDELGPF